MESLRRWVRRTASLAASRVASSSNASVEDQAQSTAAVPPASTQRPSGTPCAEASTSPTHAVELPPVYKVVTVGGGGVGKSSLIVQFMYDEFLDEYEPTKVDSYRKHVMVAGEQVMLDIVDTAGQEDYAAVRDHYLRSADGYLCVFSLSEPESLQDIIDLRDQMVRMNSGRRDRPCLLIGNKADLDDSRAVEFELAARWSDLWNIEYIETSAKTKLNVDKVFFELLRMIKADKERRQSLLENGSKSAAAAAVNCGKRSSIPARTIGSVEGDPDGRNSTRSAKRKTNTKKKKKKSKKKRMGRWRGRRRRVRNLRRVLRRLLRRFATCRVM